MPSKPLLRKPTSDHCHMAACHNSQYGEFRCGYNKDVNDTRMIFYGMRYIVDNYVSRQWTEDEVHKADMFYRYAYSSANSKRSTISPQLLTTMPSGSMTDCPTA